MTRTLLFAALTTLTSAQLPGQNATSSAALSQALGPFLQKNRKVLVDQIASWTAMPRPQVRRLMESIEKRSSEMGLLIDTKKEPEHLAEITVFATTLVMNHLARGRSFQA